MSQPPASFADRITNIAVTGPLVRIELGVVVPPTREGDKPGLIPAQTLVMPLEGFVASLGMIEAIVKKLVADGVLKARPADGAAIEASGPASQ
ncbi:MAG: hypothetical protein HZA62_12475 [Rhodocyclales bacterium]|nr:hypothetical protein [Rhodocyclales bacterium]